MHNLLSKLLRKRGIERLEELIDEEKSVYNAWDRTLSQDDMSVDKIKEFCNRMIGVIEAKWMDLEIDKEKKHDLMPYYTVYKALLGVIDGAKTEKERLERYLTQLIEQ